MFISQGATAFHISLLQPPGVSAPAAVLVHAAVSDAQQQVLYGALYARDFRAPFYLARGRITTVRPQLDYICTTVRLQSDHIPDYIPTTFRTTSRPTCTRQAAVLALLSQASYVASNRAKLAEEPQHIAPTAKPRHKRSDPPE